MENGEKERKGRRRKECEEEETGNLKGKKDKNKANLER